MVEKHVVFITPFEEERTLHIYLPDDYQTSGRRYPVMYMYDGHNLFYDEDATYGVSWGLKDYFDRHQSEIIVVGIECNHESNYRLWEFSPYDFSDPHWGEIKGLGKALMEWVVTQLKPMIDDAYPTLPDRAHTAIGGSSMGGLMAIYLSVLEIMRICMRKPIIEQIRRKRNSITISFSGKYVRKRNSSALWLNCYPK